MEHMAVIILFTVWFGFYLSVLPRVGATIAEEHGEDYEKWRLDIMW
mgnify:CR=1 FL=1